MQEDEQLLLKLKKIQDAYVSSSYKADFKKLFEEGVLKLVSGEWFQYKFKSEDWTFEKEISKINSWITFDKCIDIRINSDLTVNITVYNGNNFDGYRVDKRWEATFSGFPEEKLEIFKYEINAQFNNLATNLFEMEEEIRIKKRIEEIKKEILQA